MVLSQRGRFVICGFGVVALTAGVAAEQAAADEIELSIDAGRVTLVATGAPLTEVLAAWSRVGSTRFVDAEAVGGASVTLQLVDVAEAEALRILLRAAAGYVAAPRRPGSAGASQYDRVKILGSGQPVAAIEGGSTGAGRAGADGAGAGEPMRLEELQRLLDAVSDATGGVATAGVGAGGGRSQSGAVDAPPIRPAPTTPFPGMVVEPDEPERRAVRAGRRDCG